MGASVYLRFCKFKIAILHVHHCAKGIGLTVILTACITNLDYPVMQMTIDHLLSASLIPSQFYLTAMEKIGRRAGIKTTSWTGNGGLGQYVMWTHFVLTESTISGS